MLPPLLVVIAGVGQVLLVAPLLSQAGAATASHVAHLRALSACSCRSHTNLPMHSVCVPFCAHEQQLLLWTAGRAVTCATTYLAAIHTATTDADPSKRR